RVSTAPPAWPARRSSGLWRFAVDFAGGELAALAAANATLEAVVESSRGTLETVSARPLHPIKGYRVMFDVVPPEDSTRQIDLRLDRKSTRLNSSHVKSSY